MENPINIDKFENIIAKNEINSVLFLLSDLEFYKKKVKFMYANLVCTYCSPMFIK